MTFVRIDVSSHRRLEGPHQSSQYERSKPSVKLHETGVRVGEISLHAPSLSPRAAGRLARAHPHLGELPRGDTLGPAQRNEEEWGSSGPGTLKGEGSKALPRGACLSEGEEEEEGRDLLRRGQSARLK